MTLKSAVRWVVAATLAVAPAAGGEQRTAVGTHHDGGGVGTGASRAGAGRRAGFRFEFYEPVRPPRPFQVMVHRGAASQAPENTRPAIEHCIADALEWAEVDVRLSKDGRHVLAHDGRLDGKTHGKGLLKELTLAELKKLDAGAWFAPRFAEERLLTLAECLELAKGRINLYLDCKDINQELLAEEVVKAGMERQVVVYDDLESVKRVQKASRGKVPTMTKWHAKYGIADWLEAAGVAAVEIDADEVTAEVCRAFHEKGIKLQAKVLDEWDRPEVWDKAVAAGVDWLQTDLPEEIIAHGIWQKMRRRPVRISMHRGALRYAPENTLPAFEKAIRMGADFVEFDVRTTKDGKFFLLHNSTLDGRTTGKGPISATTSDRVAGLDAGSWFGRPFAHTKVPTLDEFLSATAGKVDLYFDAKAITPEALSEAVERHAVAERTVVYQGPEYLARLRRVNPRIRSLPPLGDPAQVEPLAARLKPYAFDTSWGILSKELIERCHRAGVLVFSDAMGEHETIQHYQQAIRWGIDLIQTDYPLRVMRAVELLEAEAKTARAEVTR